MKSEPVLKLVNIVKKFGNLAAVDGVTIDIENGKLISFLGPSGCGKTTLLRTIGGFYQQDQGDIYLDDELINGLFPNQRDTVMFFQNYALFPHMTVLENVTFGLKIQRMNKSEIQKRLEEVLSMVQLEGMEDRYPHQLSGGQQQRVALGRALILNPKLLLLDEPLSNLDANLRSYMRDEIKKIKEKLNLTVIFVTHDQEEAMSISDEIVVMKEGKIEQVGRPAEIYRYPASQYVADFIGNVNFLEAEILDYRDNGQVQLDTGVGMLKVFPPRKININKGGKVLTVLRPEAIDVLSHFPNDVSTEQNILKGEVLDNKYLGSIIRYQVRIKKETLTVEVSNPTEKDLLASGSEIVLKFPLDLHLVDIDK